MRRTTAAILALACWTGLTGCENMYSSKPKSAMLIANHTAEPIVVAFSKSPENTDSTAWGVEQRVLPEATVRFGGRMGDELVIAVDGEPPMLLPFARRNQVVKVSESSDGVSYEIIKGYTDPTKH